MILDLFLFFNTIGRVLLCRRTADGLDLTAAEILSVAVAADPDLEARTAAAAALGTGLCPIGFKSAREALLACIRCV